MEFIIRKHLGQEQFSFYLLKVKIRISRPALVSFRRVDFHTKRLGRDWKTMFGWVQIQSSPKPRPLSAFLTLDSFCCSSSILPMAFVVCCSTSSLRLLSASIKVKDERSIFSSFSRPPTLNLKRKLVWLSLKIKPLFFSYVSIPD